MKLHQATLAQVPAAIATPSYDRQALQCGIVHIGVGGFHRSHQAVYTQRLLALGEQQQWGICGVGLREADRAMKDALEAQDYLYTLIELSDQTDYNMEIVGAITEFLLAPDDPEAVIDKLADPSVRIVSLTVTEGGYNIDDSSGDFISDHPDVLHDLGTPEQPRTLFGFLAAALRRRRQHNTPPFTVMSCDNLPHNGDVARKALLSYTDLHDADLSAWIADRVSFPNAMVDRITPVTSEAHRLQLSRDHQLEDRWPVVCEPYSQWVLEDKFCYGRPDWERVGVHFTDDVTPYEAMKIGLLNGSHLAVTYLGFLMGYRFVHQAMEDELLLAFVRAYMDLDVTPQLAPVPGVDLDDYKAQLIDRFSNRAIGDQLSRTCSDGSSKFPKFIVPTLRSLIAADKDLKRSALILASWAQYLRAKKDELGEAYRIFDPRADYLQDTVAAAAQLTQNFFGMTAIFGDDLAVPPLVDAFEEALQLLSTQGCRAALERVLA
ncbi:MAG: mannitol dehydrogenase family protein [Cellvibrionaceae bacterium]|nr:mannitol dehydrogenase family protein [Cellvibrionaceae bacterium]